MNDSDLTLAILREIRDEIRQTRTELGGSIGETNGRLGETNSRLDETNSRLDETNNRLGKVEATLQELATQQLILTKYVGNVVDRHAGQISDLRERVARLEGRP